MQKWGILHAGPRGCGLVSCGNPSKVKALTLTNSRGLPQEWGPNSRGLKRICSDSSSWTFGIQGENSMKSRDEIVIIMLQWLRLYTLGSRGSRELKTFLETRLISSRVDQKFKNKEGVHEFLKEKLARKTWAVEAVVGIV